MASNMKLCTRSGNDANKLSITEKGIKAFGTYVDDLKKYINPE